MFQLESIRKKIRMQLRRHASEKRRSARIVYFLSYKLSTVNNASLVIVRGLQALGRDLKGKVKRHSYAQVLATVCEAVVESYTGRFFPKKFCFSNCFIQ